MKWLSQLTFNQYVDSSNLSGGIMNNLPNFINGDLLTVEEWLEAVAQHYFIDYDGFGDQLDINKQIIGKHIYPSQAKELLPDTKYILWYNR